MMGPHGELFGSNAKTDEDKEFEMLYRQYSMTGTFPQKFIDRLDEKWRIRMGVYKAIEAKHGKGMNWRYVMKALSIPEEDGAFIERVLKVDPEERPTAG